MSDKKRVLITGIGGALAQLVGERLAREGFQIVGVDYRPVPEPIDFPPEQIYRANYNKTKIEDIFRRHRPQLVLHLGRVGNLKERMGKRFDLNVIGSQKVMDLCAKYAVERLVVFSTFHIYGAHPHNHIPISESEPLRAGSAFPQIADAIQLDSQAVAWLYQHPEVQTVVLRPCHVVGPAIQNAISRFLRQKMIPVILGFDPMMQLVHQDDLVEVIVRTAGDGPSGVYNVTGRGSLPFREVVRLSGARAVPVPSTIAAMTLAAARLVAPVLPPYLINFLKYPCVISAAAIRRAYDWEPRIDQRAAIRSTVAATA
jgi:UDP-glucose 4-epimerase